MKYMSYTVTERDKANMLKYKQLEKPCGVDLGVLCTTYVKFYQLKIALK